MGRPAGRRRPPIANVVIRDRGAGVGWRRPCHADAGCAGRRDHGCAGAPRPRVRRSRGGRRPSAFAGGVAGAHLHMVGAAGGQSGDGGGGAGAGERAILPSAHRGALVADVVVGDGGAVARRCRPSHGEAGGAGGAHGRSGWGVWRTPRRAGRGRRIAALAGGVAGPYLHMVGAAGGQSGDGGGGAGAGERAILPSAHRGALVADVVVGDGGAVARRCRPSHGEAGGAGGAHGRSGWGVWRAPRRAGRGRRIAALADGVAGAHLNVVGVAGRQPGDGGGCTRAGEGVVRPGADRGALVAHVVVGDGRAVVRRRRPTHAQARGAGGAYGRGGRSARRAPWRAGSGQRPAAFASGVAGAHLNMVGAAGRQPGDGGGCARAGEGVIRP